MTIGTSDRQSRNFFSGSRRKSIAFAAGMCYTIIKGGDIMGKIYTIEEIREKVKPIAEKYEIEKVWLFGSYARGEATEDSDVDLLIKGFKSKAPFAYPGMFVDAEEALGEVDIVSIEALNEPANNNEMTRHFKRAVKKDAVCIYEEQG